MISRNTLDTAKETARRLRYEGEDGQARAIEALIRAAGEELPSLDLLTSTQAGGLLGVTGQTIKNWVRQGTLSGYRVGGRIMVPRDAIEEYVRRAGGSLHLKELSDDEGGEMTAEGRTGGSEKVGSA